MIRGFILTILVLGSAVGMTAMAMRAGSPPYSDAIVEIQAGAVTLELIKSDDLFSINPDAQCWQSRCPLIEIRSQFSSAAQ